MNDDDFRKLCNTFGFAPSRALREMIDCVRAQEIEACAKVCDVYAANAPENFADICAAAIRTRSNT